jgi:hypothetical protein
LVFVSDHFKAGICIFNIRGKHLRSPSLGLRNPIGIFGDTGGDLWICDHGNCRLLAIDSNSSVKDEIRLEDVLGARFGALHPSFGCSKDEMFFLILTDRSVQQKTVVSFRKSNPYNSLSILPLRNSITPVDIKFYRGKLHVGNSHPADLFTYDFRSKGFIRLNKTSFPYKLRGFTGMNDEIFANVGMCIVKVSSDGQEIFTTNMRRILGPTSYLGNGLTTMKQARNHVLLLPDGAQKCIHRFSI